MNTQQSELRAVLQALALPVSGQLRLYPNDACKVSRLIQEFEQSEPRFVAGTDCLTNAQKEVLASLHRDLLRVCLDHTCTDVALRRSDVWRRVRLLARSALLAFNWPLALPPQFEPAVVC
ncbi:MAG: hypothetical protein H6654_03030 [Ardenticatenaceae bacterium]|nr:hypothetical protein [Anaerolineales bacterium]MCB8941163.1 hypothetical protein [Ardenticatenaceae bacterium]MCB8972504.1 hypothetical protein [Ardenticatenaceae bacterium]